MIGCAAMIGAVAFILGVVGSLFAREATFVERLMMATMCAAMTFVAAVLLFSRDHLRHRRLLRRVRRMLLARHDVDDEDFAAQFPGTDRALVRETRRAVAGFFHVPEEKIHPADDLRRDLKVEKLEPGFHTSVFFHLFATRQVTPRSFVYRSKNVVGIGDLLTEIERVLAEFESS